MMVAICDDDIRDIRYLCDNIRTHSNSHEITEFLSADTFFKHIYEGEEFDLLFLDVQMPDADGWEIAKQLKRAKSKMFIAMVTIHDKYIFDCFDRVDWFAPKPISSEKIYKILDSAQERLFPTVFEFHKDNLIIAVNASEIIYFEVQRNSLFIHTTRECHEIRLSLKRVKDMVNEYCQFVQIHNSFIINLDYYDRIKESYIILKNQEAIKLSRTYRGCFYAALNVYVRGG